MYEEKCGESKVGLRLSIVYCSKWTEQIRKQWASCCDRAVWVTGRLLANTENKVGLCTGKEISVALKIQVWEVFTGERAETLNIHGLGYSTVRRIKSWYEGVIDSSTWCLYHVRPIHSSVFGPEVPTRISVNTVTFAVTATLKERQRHCFSVSL